MGAAGMLETVGLCDEGVAQSQGVGAFLYFSPDNSRQAHDSLLAYSCPCLQLLSEDDRDVVSTSHWCSGDQH